MAAITITSEDVEFGGSGATAPPGQPEPQASGGTNLITPANWFTSWATGGTMSEAGASITPEKALTYTAVYASVSLIAGTIAALPLRIYRKVSEKVTNEITDHPLVPLLNTQFNPDMSALVGRETGLGHLLTWGNSYCQIVRTLSGKVLELRPIPPNVVEVRRTKAGDLVYDIYDCGRVEMTLPARDVLHIPGLGFDGICGYSPIAMARNAIGLGLQAEKFGSKLFSQGARPSGMVKFPVGKGIKDEKARLRFREDLERMHSGADNAARVVILEDGADWQSIGIPPDDAQFLETRQFQRSEINAIYRTPPHLTGDVSASTSWGTGIEEQGIAFVVHTLRPWLTRIEQEVDRKLLDVGGPMFAQHLVDSLTRGDSDKRMKALSSLFDRGALQVNELRREMGRNPVPGGDRSFVAVNMVPLDAVDDAQEEETESQDPPAKPKPAPAKPKNQAPRNAELAQALREMFIGAVSRCVRKEAQAARRASHKPETFLAWAEDFYKDHKNYVVEQVGPALHAWFVAFPGSDRPFNWAIDFARDHCAASHQTLIETAGRTAPPGLPGLIGQVADEWERTRAARVATTELTLAE